MTNLKDLINDFGLTVLGIIEKDKDAQESDGPFFSVVEQYDEALEECMDRVKKLMGTE